MARTARRRIVRYDPAASERPDTLAVEAPLEIRVGGQTYTVTMRTPGADTELALGFLVGEGLLTSGERVIGARECREGTDAEDEGGMVDVRLEPALEVLALSRRRAFPTTSACGVCGVASVADIRSRAGFDLHADALAVSPGALLALPARLRSAQQVFDATGGLHAAGLFDPEGHLLCLREDVGRHNAVDKVVGWALQEGRLPLRGHVLLVSGRASFELVQKALLAGVPLLAAVSAPSSLAVDLAAASGMTLVGFLREGSLNVYSAPQRVRAA